MPLRPFKLPADIPLLIELIPPAFQYPENEAWSLQAEEKTSFVDTLRGFQRIWPLIRVVQFLSPPLRDALRGYVWEEDGKAVGLTNVLRQGATDRWYIGNVAVLPDYRRRGIARKLVEACVQYARDRGAKSITLDVVHGNLPAFNLYEKLGFEHYSGQTELIIEAGRMPALAEIALPEGYTVEARPMMDWRPRYELAKRVTPAHVQKYMPVEEGRFRQPPVLRLLAPIIRAATGQRPQLFVVRCGPEIAATVTCISRLRAGGVNSLSAMVDPAHAAAAPALVNFALRYLEQVSPGRRVEMTVTRDQTTLVAAALAAGFVRRADHDTMGILVQ